ncbi:MAG: hypothetical protein IAG10_34645, partial [Planctomycetaceae bacterium]|nr:hypothetical protein [Planctomycetaceae bacterium]
MIFSELETVTDLVNAASRAIVGTSGNDAIAISDPVANDRLTRITVSGVALNVQQTSGSILVNGGAGNDTLTL